MAQILPCLHALSFEELPDLLASFTCDLGILQVLPIFDLFMHFLLGLVVLHVGLLHSTLPSIDVLQFLLVINPADGIWIEFTNYSH